MLVEPRCYQGSGAAGDLDLARMEALLQAGQAASIPAYYVHPGDLKWWLYYPPVGSSWWQHIFLWDDPEDASRLLGWALIDPSGETFDIFYQPELHATATAQAMLAWGERAAMQNARSAGRDQVGIFWVLPRDTFRTGWLEDRGYTISYQSAALTRSLADPIPTSPLPDGYEVRACRGLDEVESRARAQHGAFSSKIPFEPYVQRFTRFMQSPVYDPQSDIVAAAPDGSIAAFAITWIDTVNRVGLFEPVGTHPDHQRKGLGRAVLFEALSRLQARGMTQAIVSTGEQNTPALELYRAAGFEQYSAFRFYAKDLAAA